ncbi:unnamed protein product [Calicophoron daubneyi]|uniref:Uncharacterized protein n=1 Tax=Calicophoron daubneyi TaxID=300641 RepID=A0AAV2T464_CALDB
MTFVQSNLVTAVRSEHFSAWTDRLETNEKKKANALIRSKSFSRSKSRLRELAQSTRRSSQRVRSVENKYFPASLLKTDGSSKCKTLRYLSPDKLFILPLMAEPIESITCLLPTSSFSCF